MCLLAHLVVIPVVIPVSPLEEYDVSNDFAAFLQLTASMLWASLPVDSLRPGATLAQHTLAEARARYSCQCGP